MTYQTVVAVGYIMIMQPAVFIKMIFRTGGEITNLTPVDFEVIVLNVGFVTSFIKTNKFTFRADKLHVDTLLHLWKTKTKGRVEYRVSYPLRAIRP